MRKNSVTRFAGVPMLQSVKLAESPNMSFMSLLSSKNSKKDAPPRMFSPSEKENHLNIRFSFNPSFAKLPPTPTEIPRGFQKNRSKRSSIFEDSSRPPYDHLTIDLSKKEHERANSVSTTRKHSLSSDRRSLIGNSVSGNSVSGNSVSGNSVSGNSVSGNSVSGNSVSGNSVSGNSVIGNSVNLKPFSTQEENIRVYIRIRPTGGETKGSISLLNSQTIKIEENMFAFDEVFDQSTEQSTIFEKVCSPLCERLFRGFNGTIFAYGQTGSGKTFTIFGEERNQGLIFRAISYILAQKTISKQKYSVKCSMVELYKEVFMDMFAGSRELKLKETKEAGVFIDGLKEVSINSEEELMHLVREASKYRKVAATKINEQSSRSHTILSIYLQAENVRSKLCLIDLAGSEKVNKSEVKGAAFEQTKTINYSLSCLGNVINALTTRSKTGHIPFRDSKLTRILKDCLTGNFLTSVIVNCSATSKTTSETLSSLKFAERAKKVKLSCVPELLINRNQSLDYLRSVIDKLNNDLEVTKQQLKKYKDVQPVHHRTIVLTKPDKRDKAQPMSRESSRERSQEKSDSRGRESNRSEMSQFNPIPSERAHVTENIQKYSANVLFHPRKMSVNLQELSSLNVSKTIKHLGMESPSLSSLSMRQDQNPDLSLSFSVDEERKTANR